MHIPDNFLSTPVWASLDAMAIPAVADRVASSASRHRQQPVAAAWSHGRICICSADDQLSGRSRYEWTFVGGTLLACLLGPWAAALVMTAILIVQALIFQDGGVLALGANVINMALLGVLAGYLPARWFSGSRWKSFGVFLGRHMFRTRQRNACALLNC